MPSRPRRTTRGNLSYAGQVAPLYLNSDGEQDDLEYDDSEESEEHEREDPSDGDDNSDGVIDNIGDDDAQGSDRELSEGDADIDLTGVQRNGKEQDVISSDEEEDHSMCYPTSNLL